MYRALTGENAGNPHLFGKTTALVVTSGNFPFGTAVPQNILGQFFFFFWQVNICLILRHKLDSI